MGVEDHEKERPSGFGLRQSYPNPFSINRASGAATTTAITYELSRPAHVSIAIYDVLGRTIRALVEETKPAGVFQVGWNGRDLNQQPVAAGIYLCRMEVAPAGSSQRFVQQRKMLVVKN